MFKAALGPAASTFLTTMNVAGGKASLRADPDLAAHRGCALREPARLDFPGRADEVVMIVDVTAAGYGSPSGSGVIYREGFLGI